MRGILGPAAALLLLGAAPSTMGGWAVITIRDLPARFEAGRPATIEFTVRQHGDTPMRGLSPRVIARRKGTQWYSRALRVRARAGAREGSYVAELTLPDTGEVVITLDADWHSAEITLLPIAVLPPGAAPVPVAAASLGQQLFVAKGCVTCHRKWDDRDLRGRTSVQAGPDLTGRRLASEYVAAKLANPALNRVRFSEYVVMPDLELSPPEITALVSYLTAEVVQASRR